MISAPEVVTFPDGETLADLATFVGRARRIDPDGAARITAVGDVLATYVSPVHGGGGPVVLGLRVVRLAAESRIDTVVAIAALEEALAAARRDGDDALVVPAGQVTGVAWAGTSPPRGGWLPVGELGMPALAETAAAGIAEIVSGAPAGSGAAAVAALRARVWGRPLAPDRPELAGLPAGVALVAEALGFVDGEEPAIVYRSGPWWRVTMPRGHVLARRPALA
jgi:hypothetical protein